MSTENEPLTESGRALLDDWLRMDIANRKPPRGLVSEQIAAIEREAAERVIRQVAAPEPQSLRDLALEVVRFYGTDRTWSLQYRTLLGSRIDDLAAALAAAQGPEQARDTGGLPRDPDGEMDAIEWKGAYYAFADVAQRQVDRLSEALAAMVKHHRYTLEGCDRDRWGHCSITDRASAALSQGAAHEEREAEFETLTARLEDAYNAGRAACEARQIAVLPEPVVGVYPAAHRQAGAAHEEPQNPNRPPKPPGPGPDREWA